MTQQPDYPELGLRPWLDLAEAEERARRQKATQAAIQDASEAIFRMSDHAMLFGTLDPTTATYAHIRTGECYRPPLTTRSFVCQGCGKVHDVLHGGSVICRCGARSAAEILEPRR